MAKSSNYFTPGICFLCRQPCDPLAYAHYHCSLAYSDEKNKRALEAQKAKEARR